MKTMKRNYDPPPTKKQQQQKDKKKRERKKKRVSPKQFDGVDCRISFS